MLVDSAQHAAMPARDTPVRAGDTRAVGGFSPSLRRSEASRRAASERRSEDMMPWWPTQWCGTDGCCESDVQEAGVDNGNKSGK
jgi:hypothetical protein